MGVDWYACKNCGETFPDCGDFVSCEYCGERWCSYDCAETDGYVSESCKLDIDMEDDEEKESNPNCPNHRWCSDCNNYIGDSCGYCRGDIIEDSELLEYALNLLDMGRNELEKLFKNSK